MTEVANKSWKQAPGWMKLVLLVSLLGNAAVAGIVAGHMMHDRGWKREPGMTRSQSRILHMVPEAKRDMARAILKKDAGVSTLRAGMDKAQAAIMDALRADPFSPDKLMAAMQARSSVWQQASQDTYRELADIAAKLTPAERAQMADNMEKRYRRWAERRRDEH